MNTDKSKKICADLCPIKKSANYADCASIAQILSYLYINRRPDIFLAGPNV
jgi:hypothetical protein